MLKVGDEAPDFETVLDDGTRFRLSDLHGDKNVVLYFYPADFTGGCTAEACSFRDNYDTVKQYDAVILGVSRDSQDSHARFREKHSLGFPLIADEDQKIAAMYDAAGSFLGIRPRVTYVIDKQGVIRAAFRHDIAIGRHLSDTLDALEELQKSAAA
jgi:peroxiredoxin Q/BCP